MTQINVNLLHCNKCCARKGCECTRGKLDLVKEGFPDETSKLIFDGKVK